MRKKDKEKKAFLVLYIIGLVVAMAIFFIFNKTWQLYPQGDYKSGSNCIFTSFDLCFYWGCNYIKVLWE